MSTPTTATSTNGTTRTALVTGATSGIGRATAQALADAGMHVVLSGRDTERGKAAVEEIRAGGGQADFVAADLHDATSATTLAREAEQVAGGRIDVLVNNAGGATFVSTAETTEADFDAMYGLNVKAPYFLTAALAPAMAERGDGVVVNVSTMVADIGVPGAGVYGSAKAALSLLTKSWAAEFAPRGVRVNAVSPGPIRTEGALATLGDAAAVDAMGASVPAHRVGTPEEVASAISYLVSPAAAFIHGVVLPVDGGRVAV